MPRILIIDDDLAVRETIAAVLAEAGHLVTLSADGGEGLKLFRAEPADLVVTDLVMPSHEGLEVVTALHREYPDLPIIAMSGTGPRSHLYLDMAAKLGATRTLAKPFTSTTLLHLVAELLPPSAPPPSRR